jgi:NAD(P)-dependent dehydrogenase (short-subunit alcohol dehydrogenase family)
MARPGETSDDRRVRVIVTGGNSGIGKATAAALAAAGHSIVIACRTIPKAEQAAAEMTGDVEVAYLDLADLTSVRKFADSVESVDALVNNAGVLGLPPSRTADGFEAHMGTNYLGHFALTCLLGDRIKDRVISVVSAAYALSRIHLDDLNWHTRKYSKWAAYAESKLAIMLFSYELARRGARVYLTDPGATDTDIAREATGLLPWIREHTIRHFPAHSAAVGARASIAAVTTDLPSGSYLAPRFSQWGKPKVTKIRKKARDAETARRLWELSASLTGCDWQTTTAGGPV